MLLRARKLPLQRACFYRYPQVSALFGGSKNHDPLQITGNPYFWCAIPRLSAHLFLMSCENSVSSQVSGICVRCLHVNSYFVLLRAQKLPQQRVCFHRYPQVSAPFGGSKNHDPLQITGNFGVQFLGYLHTSS